MIWREKRWLLIVLVTLLVANAAFFFAYRVRYEERISGLDTELEDARANLAAQEKRHRDAGDRIVSRETTVDDLRLVYDDHWATKDERLAALIVELQQLARRSGLEPPTRNYDVEESTSRETAISGAEALTVSFVVKGRYEEIRNLINLIELSRHFLIIDAITITRTSGDSEEISLTLAIRTVFKADESTLPEGAVI